MSAFAPTDLPSTVNTVEKLAVWSCSILAELNPNLLVQSRFGELEPTVQVTPLRLQFEQTNPIRVAILGYIPLETNWRNSRIWSVARELSTTAIPNAYRQ